MLTNNYYAYKKMMFSGYGSYSGTHPKTIEFTAANGSVFGNNTPSVYCQYSYQGDLGFWLNKARCTTFPTSKTESDSEKYGVYFGTGATPATLADYRLENPIETGLSITNPLKYSFNDNGEGKWTYSASYVLTNTSGAEINIHEIGILTWVGSDSSAKHPVLMERTVLTESITIPAGGAKLVTVTVTQNNVLNVE